MNPSELRFPTKRAGVGGLLGMAVGVFAAVPWGTFAGPESPGWWLAAPLVLGFTVMGAWVATVASLSALERAAPHHETAHHEEDLHSFGGHAHTTPA